MTIRTVLTAAEGMILTNGEVYGRIIYLADGTTPDSFYEITDEEYENMVAETTEDSLN